MKRYISTALFAFLMAACATNPFTGKKTMALVSNDELFASAFQQYDTFLKENKVISGTKDAQRVKKVGQRIAVAAEKWLNANGYEGYLKDYKWEYNLVDDKQVNAWCMPGGKIVVYTGLLPIAQSDAGLAVVMGHEVAHALANHGQQRMSAGVLQQAGATGVAIATGGKSTATQELWMKAYGVGSQVGGMLPFSRSHETEADKIGIQLMAIAGYNPDEAAKLWVRMSENSGGAAPSEILSTHPSSQTRISNLTSWAPAARTEAKKFGVTSFQ
ncbi:M48 family metallopeptidase [Zhouia spongiae]|uniref:M48 family metallopeptidase n=1 Tax=Zhouia spongiae TaxID=2202721 RepID=A0ABY3YLV7_9FLAO|nr:M48 family metallopeptidase [Zhouia spongiae]UNY98678.1 M48 family metallopeptidase [Zhouia spongiae]